MKGYTRCIYFFLLDSIFILCSIIVLSKSNLLFITNEKEEYQLIHNYS